MVFILVFKVYQGYPASVNKAFVNKLNTLGFNSQIPSKKDLSVDKSEDRKNQKLRCNNFTS